MANIEMDIKNLISHFYANSRCFRDIILIFISQQRAANIIITITIGRVKIEQKRYMHITKKVAWLYYIIGLNFIIIERASEIISVAT